MKNKDMQSRRDFFKITIEKALPLLGAIAIVSLSMPACAIQNTLTGYDGCNNSCKGRCEWGCAENGCKVGCHSSCSGSCENSSKNN